VKTAHGATLLFDLSTQVRDELQTLSQREGVTMFMTLLAAWQLLLFRYSGQTDILVGTPIANRRHRQLEPLIGFFVNTLVLRTDLSGDPSVRELLRRVREVCLGGYAHQDVPFEMLVEELQPERSLSHSPLFQVAFALQNTPMPEIELDALSLSTLEVSNATAKFDLTLSMAETAEGLTGVVEYNTDLFEPATIEHMLAHFHSLLEEVADAPGRAISAFPLLTPGEHR
jgi:non-ribosomal peptide synthetase component F